MNIVLSGPSGSGKGTLTEMLLKNSGFKNLQHALQENLVMVKRMDLITTFLMKKNF